MGKANGVWAKQMEYGQMELVHLNKSDFVRLI